MEELSVNPVSPTGGREWRTEGEIRSICRNEVGTVLDKLLDGAQAAINTALILHGNPELGVKGALPEMQERLQHLEEAHEADRALAATNHTIITDRLAKVEGNQGKLQRCLDWIAKQAEKVNVIWKVAGGLAAGVGVHAYWSGIITAVERLFGGR